MDAEQSDASLLQNCREQAGPAILFACAGRNTAAFAKQNGQVFLNRRTFDRQTIATQKKKYLAYPAYSADEVFARSGFGRASINHR